MKTNTISERGKIYIQRNGGNSDGRNRIFHEPSKGNNSGQKPSPNNTRTCSPKR